MAPAVASDGCGAPLPGVHDRGGVRRAFVFDWEVRNVLLAKLRGGGLNASQLDRVLAELETFGVVAEEPEDAERLRPSAQSQALSLFDASYLALALRSGAALASLDRGLLSAAVRCGVPVHDLRDP